VELHAEQIKAESRRRAVLTAARHIVSSVYEERDPAMVETKAKEILLGAIGSADTGNHLLSPAQLGNLAKEYFTNKTKGELSVVPTGFPTMDNLLGGGLRRGDLITLAARTSVGKSSLAENIAEYIAKNSGTVLFVSIEMTPEQIIYRSAVRSGKLSKAAIEYGVEHGNDMKALNAMAADMASTGFHLLNAPTATTTAVRSAASRLQMQSGPLSLIVIDYLQLLKDRTREEERLNIGAMTSTLKMIAREFHVPVLLLSQLNRQIEYRGGEPHLSDLRESGRIEEDSDVVILLWKMESKDTLGNETKGKIEKNRQGPTGPIPITFHAPSFRFSERSDGTVVPVPEKGADRIHVNDAPIHDAIHEDDRHSEDMADRILGNTSADDDRLSEFLDELEGIYPEEAAVE
jgi:replicative DNA helicase